MSTSKKQKTGATTAKRIWPEYVPPKLEWCPRYEQWSITNIKWAAHTMNIPYPICRTTYKELNSTVVPLLKKTFRENREQRRAAHKVAWTEKQERLDCELAARFVPGLDSDGRSTRTRANLASNNRSGNTGVGLVKDTIKSFDAAIKEARATEEVSPTVTKSLSEVRDKLEALRQAGVDTEGGQNLIVANSKNPPTSKEAGLPGLDAPSTPSQDSPPIASLYNSPNNSLRSDHGSTGSDPVAAGSFQKQFQAISESRINELVQALTSSKPDEAVTTIKHNRLGWHYVYAKDLNSLIPFDERKPLGTEPLDNEKIPLEADLLDKCLIMLCKRVTLDVGASGSQPPGLCRALLDNDEAADIDDVKTLLRTRGFWRQAYIFMPRVFDIDVGTKRQPRTEQHVALVVISPLYKTVEIIDSNPPEVPRWHQLVLEAFRILENGLGTEFVGSEWRHRHDKSPRQEPDSSVSEVFAAVNAMCLAFGYPLDWKPTEEHLKNKRMRLASELLEGRYLDPDSSTEFSYQYGNNNDGKALGTTNGFRFYNPRPA